MRSSAGQPVAGPSAMAGMKLLFNRLRLIGGHRRLLPECRRPRDRLRSPQPKELFVDLNRLFSRHQFALDAVVTARCDESRSWAHICADYYADRITDARTRVDGASPLHWLPAKR
jgi:hypothetical protein